jgi:transcriptional regulator with XRE-family HTH domain
MATTAAGTTSVELGRSIRTVREQRGLSLRELARRVDVSPSFISQIELGKANPSVGTLYSIVSVLGTTLDDLIGEPDRDAGPELLDAALAGGTPSEWPRVGVPVQPAEGRSRVEMSGVVWERLTHDHDPYVDFLHVEYAPGSSSCAPDQLMRHGGREYGHLVRGRLDVQVGFETYSLGPGDSIHFDSSTPHRLSNPYDEPCTAVWFVLARRDDDRPRGLE